MARKPPICYQPVETYDYGDLIVEVYPDDQLPNGRGLPGRYKKFQTFHNALELLWDAGQDAKKGLRAQLFADLRKSGIVLERELTKRYGRRHSIQIQQRICRAALRTWGLTGDDSVRLPYLLDIQGSVK